MEECHRVSADIHYHSFMKMQKRLFGRHKNSITQNILQSLTREPPEEYGYDRGGWSEDHIEKIKNLGVKKVAIAPKGQAKWKVSNRCKEKMVRERAQCEGSIGCLKRVGFNRPCSKNTQSSLRAGQRAALRLNLTKIVRDINNTSKVAA